MTIILTIIAWEIGEFCGKKAWKSWQEFKKFEREDNARTDAWLKKIDPEKNQKLPI